MGNDLICYKCQSNLVVKFAKDKDNDTTKYRCENCDKTRVEIKKR